MSRNNNSYTIAFAAIFTGTFGILLAVLATALQPMQDKNRELETMSSIMGAVGYVGADKEKIRETFNRDIEQVVINTEGEVIGGDEAFDIDLRDQQRKHRADSDYEMQLPLFIYKGGDEDKYIIPLEGNGLWGAVWGFIALESDFNTVAGAVFDHAGETPGLGAEIRTREFQQRFEGKQIYDDEGNLVSIRVLQGTGNTTNEHQVDGLSGATITLNGVTNMLRTSFNNYEAYFIKKRDEAAM